MHDMHNPDHLIQLGFYIAFNNFDRLKFALSIGNFSDTDNLVRQNVKRIVVCAIRSDVRHLKATGKQAQALRLIQIIFKVTYDT